MLRRLAVGLSVSVAALVIATGAVAAISLTVSNFGFTLTLDAEVASVWLEASVNVVDVIVAFQPAPEPRASVIDRGRV